MCVHKFTQHTCVIKYLSIKCPHFPTPRHHSHIHKRNHLCALFPHFPTPRHHSHSHKHKNVCALSPLFKTKTPLSYLQPHIDTFCISIPCRQPCVVNQNFSLGSRTSSIQSIRLASWIFRPSRRKRPLRKWRTISAGKNGAWRAQKGDFFEGNSRLWAEVCVHCSCMCSRDRR
jgi:hypothetical protein